MAKVGNCSILGRVSCTVWDSLELSGTVWDSLELSGTLWDSLELSGTVWDSVGLSGTLLTQLGHTQIELLDGWDLKIRGRLSEFFETLLLLEHLAVLIIS